VTGRGGEGTQGGGQDWKKAKSHGKSSNRWTRRERRVRLTRSIGAAGGAKSIGTRLIQKGSVSERNILAFIINHLLVTRDEFSQREGQAQRRHKRRETTSPPQRTRPTRKKFKYWLLGGKKIPLKLQKLTKGGRTSKENRVEHSKLAEDWSSL